MLTDISPVFDRLTGPGGVAAVDMLETQSTDGYGWLQRRIRKRMKIYINSISQRVFITEVGSSPPDGRKIIPVTEGDLRKWHKNKSAHYKRHHGKVV